MILLQPTYGTVTAKLTVKGKSCVDLFDGDPDEMEYPRMTNSFNIGNYNQQGGNSAFGSTVGSQIATTTVTIGQTAADLIALLQIVQDMGGIPEEYEQEAAEVVAELRTAVTPSDPEPALGRARRFFHAVSATANTNPLTVAVLTAAGNYAALRIGLPTK